MSSDLMLSIQMDHLPVMFVFQAARVVLMEVQNHMLLVVRSVFVQQGVQSPRKPHQISWGLVVRWTPMVHALYRAVSLAQAVQLAAPTCEALKGLAAHPPSGSSLELRARQANASPYLTCSRQLPRDLASMLRQVLTVTTRQIIQVNQQWLAPPTPKDPR